MMLRNCRSFLFAFRSYEAYILDSWVVMVVVVLFFVVMKNWPDPLLLGT